MGNISFRSKPKITNPLNWKMHWIKWSFTYILVIASTAYYGTGLGLWLLIYFIELLKYRSERRTPRSFKKSKELPDLVIRYTSKQLSELKNIENIGELSIDQLENKMKQLLDNNIQQFSELLKLNGLTPPNRHSMVNYCFSQSEILINSIKDTLKEYLSVKLLDKDLKEFDIQLQIDRLIDAYEQTETSKIGKVDAQL